MLHKVLFIDTAHPILAEKLKQSGFICDFNTTASKEEISAIISKYAGVILRSRITFDRELIDKANSLKFIARVGAGLESIDVDYAQSKGITCLNSPEGNRDAVAEHCLGMLLSLNNNLCKANAEVKNAEWLREPNRGSEIMNKTIGIIGYGNMGSAFAKRLQGFGCKILAYDKYKTGYGTKLVKECNMDELFANCDILSLHVPLTEETHYLLNSEYINRFKKSIILINTARGLVVNTQALIQALETGKILGAALDVIEFEDSSFEHTKDMSKIPAFNKLKAMQKVIMSPHIAGWTVESRYKLATVLAEKIISLNTHKA